MTNFHILAGADTLSEGGELEKEDKKLIILMELAKYNKENNNEPIRYSQLRGLSDNRLNEFTDGFQTNFGGAFEIYIKEFEKEGYLRRVKEGPGKTLIFPDISEIENLLDKKGLKNYLNKMDVEAVYETPTPMDSLHLSGGILLPDNFPNYLVNRIDHYNHDGLQNSISLLSIPWKIYIACDKDKNFQLSEPTIQELLDVGKTIASKDKSMSFKISLEYNGSM
jgi:hypothetical protein